MSWTPNLIMPGIAKCGTTTLYDILVAHPRVTGGIEKEVRFLMDPQDELCPQVNLTHSGLGAWASQYADQGKGDFDIWLDASPQYQYQACAQTVLASLEPKPKILFIVRKPSKRLYSLYQYARYQHRALAHITSFSQFIDEVRAPKAGWLARQRMLLNAWEDSKYDALLERWSIIAGAGNLFVTSVEEMSQDRTQVLGDLASWLGIAAEPLITAEIDRSNPTTVTKSRLLRKYGSRLARLLPENGPIRKIKDTVRKLNSSEVDSGELAANAALLEELDATFEPHMQRFDRLREELAVPGMIAR